MQRYRASDVTRDNPVRLPCNKWLGRDVDVVAGTAEDQGPEDRGATTGYDMTDRSTGYAFVIGDRNLAVPLHAAGASVVIVGPRSNPARFSRFVHSFVEDPRSDEDARVAALLARAAELKGPAALFYQFDGGLLFVSRRRDELAKGLRFVVPSAELVESLVDKAAFQQLASNLDLPVPPSTIIDVSDAHGVIERLSYPVLVKPLRREASWRTFSKGKAELVDRQEDMATLLQAFGGRNDRLIAQTLIPGPETRIESYHVHVASSGEIAVEFTGRKLRTHPASMGHSTALVTTDAADVADLGRSIIHKLGLRGVAKLDFKRDLDGRLWLLEVNPRFNLWHHVGAAAGADILGSVWAELLGLPRPPVTRARPGVTWCRLEHDIVAAHQQGMKLARWSRWAVSSDTKSTVDFADPLPWLMGSALKPLYRRRLGATTTTAAG